MATEKDEIAVELSPDKAAFSAKGSAASRATNAIVDAVSPFTEGLGAIGDVVKYYRQDMAIKSINRSKELADKLGIPIRPVPPKFLIDWIEKSSLESSNDQELTDMWAGLLVTASAAFDAKLFLFKKTLSEFTSEHIDFISILCDHDFKSSTEYVPSANFNKLTEIYKNRDEILELENLDRSLHILFDECENKRFKIWRYKVIGEFDKSGDPIVDHARLRNKFKNFEDSYVIKSLLDSGFISLRNFKMKVSTPSNFETFFFIDVDALYLANYGVDFLKACIPANAKHE